MPKTWVPSATTPITDNEPAMAIISLRHGLVFIKTRKTAGTSIEIDLGKLLDPEAIITPIFPEHPGHHPRNFSDHAGNQLYYNHMSATEIEARLGRKTFASLYRFCVEREPVEKCISHFHMLRNSPNHRPGCGISWAEYCAIGKFPVDVHKYSVLKNGRRRLQVDRVLRFDALRAQLDEVMAHVGLPGFRLHTHAKAQYSLNRLISPEDVLPAQRKQIYDAFQETIETTFIDWSCPP